MLKLSKSCAVSMTRPADGAPRLSRSASRRLAERVFNLVDNSKQSGITATGDLEMTDAVPARQIMKTGILKRMFAEKGFGFVIADDGPKGDLFVHVKRNPALKGIDRGGAAVIFDLEWDAPAGKYIGVNCEVTGGGGGRGDAGAAASGFRS